MPLYVHVARSAVTQWVKRKGMIATVIKHFIDIVLTTNTSLKWLAAVRGHMQVNHSNLLTEIDKPINKGYQAHNALEHRSLNPWHDLAMREALVIVEMMKCLGLSIYPRKETYDPKKI